MPGLNIYLSSVPPELEAYRQVVLEVVGELGHAAICRDPTPRAGLDSLSACARQVARADFVVLLVGWRLGGVPSPAEGGDGARPWVFWEARCAFAHGRELAVFLADDSWPPACREEDAEARAVLADLRRELGRLAVAVAPHSGDLASFRSQVRTRLARSLIGRTIDPDATTLAVPAAVLRLRGWPEPELPERPYPLLLPYHHPALFAGRERELRQLEALLELPVPITGLYAVSGAGKSSFLDAGLVRGLRARGRPAALDRHPCEPGLARRLLEQLVEGTAGFADPGRFMERLAAIRSASGAAAVLVIDQLEDLFRAEAGRARAEAGALLAAAAQRFEGLAGPPCRFVLAYRQEFHGDVFAWLGDVFRDLHATQPAAPGSPTSAVERLPSDLTGPERFQIFPLAPLGTPAAGCGDPAAAATETFLEILEKPLRGGRYPWRFGAGGAVRLARAFGEARARQHSAPLLPELQVVLARLFESAGEPGEDRTAVLEVPAEPGELIETALEEHLLEALEQAFPGGQGGETRIARTRALLALRELADDQGRRREGVAELALAQAIGEEGRDVLERLSTPATRLVVPERKGDELTYLLAHDRLAEVVVRLVDQGLYAGLGIDRELLSLRRYVELKSELFAAGQAAPAIEVSPGHFERIEKYGAALLWGEKRRRWWQACSERRRRALVRRRRHLGVAGLALVALGFLTFELVDRRLRLEAAFAAVEEADPEPAFAAAYRLVEDLGQEPTLVSAKLLRRQQPFDVFDRGAGGVPAAIRPAAVLRMAELALPLLLEEQPENPEWIGSLVWALDFFAPAGRRARELRDLALAPLRRKFPPPPLSGPEAPPWVEVPGGTFQAGPQLQWPITQAAFRMGVYEVTDGELRRLFAARPPAASPRHPVTGVTWYEAYVYAAWLGGRLPTQAEGEYVRRWGCRFAFCDRHQRETKLEKIAWTEKNSLDPLSGDPTSQPVGQLEPNPLGLYDLLGNVGEMTASWDGDGRGSDDPDSPEPTRSPRDCRVISGGSAWRPEAGVSAVETTALPLGRRSVEVGLRVVFPVPRPEP